MCGILKKKKTYKTESYEFVLKEPIFIKKKGKFSVIKNLKFLHKPAYYIEANVVYVETWKDMYWPIVDEVDRFKEKMKIDK